MTKKSLFNVVVLIIFGLLSSRGSADERENYQKLQLMNAQMHLMHDSKSKRSPHEAYANFRNGEFIANTNNQVSIGFTSDTVWGLLPVVNQSQHARSQVVKIDNAWLDEVDVYFFHNDHLQHQVSLGDNQDFILRPTAQRMPTLIYAFAPGQTDVLFRFRSQDPMTIPVYLGTRQALQSKTIENGYFYGALYGALLILLIYNIALYAYLRELKYLLYSIYLLAFTTFNFTYTGHGFWLLWPESIGLQQWLMPSLMFCYLLSGVMFTLEFLNTRVFLPTLYALRQKIYTGLLLLAAILFLFGDRSSIIWVQLIILSTMSIWMIVIGVLTYRNGNPLAKFFLPAIIMGTGGATVSSFATWGSIPYSQWAFRGIEIGMLLEMSLLSFSLGFNFKMAQEARKSAESNARLDPLTNLYNRRAFTDLVRPIWELGKRNSNPMAIALIDLDWFKKVNDEFGHDVGDMVLTKVALVLKSRLRDSDIPLRWGGEEFLIFLPNTDRQEAKLLAESLRDHFDTKHDDNAPRITISIGVASTYPGDMELNKLITLADKALYSAKQKGRNCVVGYS